jgi:hypothetical protein
MQIIKLKKFKTLIILIISALAFISIGNLTSVKLQACVNFININGCVTTVSCGMCKGLNYGYYDEGSSSYVCSWSGEYTPYQCAGGPSCQECPPGGGGSCTPQAESCGSCGISNGQCIKNCTNSCSSYDLFCSPDECTGGPPGGTNNPKGYFDYISCSAINGWTCDADDYSQALEVEVYFNAPKGQPGSVLKGTYTANAPREAAVGVQCGGNTARGFAIPTPSGFFPSSNTQVYVYAKNIGGGYDVLLQTSPQGSGSAGNCCIPSTPADPVLNLPANGATIPSSDSANLTWTVNGYGVSCPSNANAQRVYMMPRPSSGVCPAAGDAGYLGVTPASGFNPTASTYQVTGLTENTNYCWYVQKWNGSQVSRSEVWTFRTSANPVIQTVSGVTFDQCGNATTGIFNAANPNVSNPITIRMTFTDDAPINNFYGKIMLIPRTPPATNPTTIPWNNAHAQAWSNNSFVVGMDTFGPGATPYSYYFANNAGNIITGPAYTGELNSQINPPMAATPVARLVTISQSGKVSGRGTNTVSIDFTIRFNNNFGTGALNWDIYGGAVVQNADETFSASDYWAFRKIRDWKFDFQSPVPTISNLIFNGNGTFNLTYGVTDNFGLTTPSFPTIDGAVRPSTQSGNIQQDGVLIPINTTAGAYTQLFNSVFSGTNYNRTSTYQDQTGTAGNQLTFRLTGYDIGCNPFNTTTSVNRASPWILNVNNDLSVNDEVYVTSVPQSMQLPSINNLNINIPGRFTYGPTTSSLGTDSVFSGIPSHVATPSDRVSQKNLYSTTYQNNAVELPDGSSSWYTYLLNLLERDGTLQTLTTGAIQSTSVAEIPQAKTLGANTGLSNFLSVAAGTKRHAKVVGNTDSEKSLWLTTDNSNRGLICDTQSIIFVPGDLLISPNVTVSSSTNACIFVVGGDVVVGRGTVNNSIPVNSTTQPVYDILEMTIIADGEVNIYQDIPNGGTFKGDGVYMLGSVISRTNFHMLRDLNADANSTHPAMIINNDGRNREIFRDDLNTGGYSIREFFD